MQIITSKDNEIIKNIRKLKEKKYRDLTNSYLIEGVKMIKEAIEENAKIKQIVVCEDCLKEDGCTEQKILYQIAKYDCIYVSGKVFSYLTDVVNPQGMLAVIEKESGEEEIKYTEDIIIVLDGIQDPNTLGTLCYSFGIASVTTVVCLLMAYPVAYILATSKLRAKSVILMLFVMPMWINFSLRITALKEILTWIEGSLAYHPFLNTVLGMSYDFLPFMILPIYTTISKLDGALLEAARDLGAGNIQAFLKVTLPLSMPGIISGVSMVFLPAMTNYVVLDMLYNSTYIMGSLIGSYFAAYNWHGGSMIALILLGIVCLFTLFTRGIEEENTRGGMLL